MVQEQAEYIRIRLQLPTVFTPAAPVRRKELFAGRIDQLTQVIGAVSQVGQHVVIFGERGVGKTSLASLLGDFWADIVKDSNVISVRINCDTEDGFESIWKRIAEDVDLAGDGGALTRASNHPAFLEARKEILASRATAHSIRRYLELANKSFILIIDEFDRVDDDAIAGQFADTIKSLSDHSVDTTIVVVGVADTVEDLIHEHASVDRALVQVLMPRMSATEIRQIVETGLAEVGMTVKEAAAFNIAKFSQGLPHYAHLLGLNSGLSAISTRRKEVDLQDVRAALEISISKAQESIKNAYYQATLSPRRDNLYRQVILACALAPIDDLGYFAPADVREPMSRVMGRPYDIPSFVRHLNALCTKERGSLLHKIGTERKRRFRFTNPILKPYILLRGIEEQMIREDDVELN